MAVDHAATAPFTEFRFTSADGLPIACGRWESGAPFRGVVQIAHGMGEHIGRYAAVIEVLVSAGFTVYGNDHRGHGRTARSTEQLGDFGEGGFDLLVEDMLHLSRIAKEENPDRPFILLGHSMGSFAAQQYVLEHSREIDGLILSGSGRSRRDCTFGEFGAPGNKHLECQLRTGPDSVRLAKPGQISCRRFYG